MASLAIHLNAHDARYYSGFPVTLCKEVRAQAWANDWRGVTCKKCLKFKPKKVK